MLFIYYFLIPLYIVSFNNQNLLLFVIFVQIFGVEIVRKNIRIFFSIILSFAKYILAIAVALIAIVLLISMLVHQMGYSLKYFLFRIMVQLHELFCFGAMIEKGYDLEILMNFPPILISIQFLISFFTSFVMLWIIKKTF